MKKLITLFAALCLCLLMVPTTAEAKDDELTSEYFTVDVDIGDHGLIAPGDFFTETFTLTNTSKKELLLHLYDVENRENSKLYSAITAKFDVKGESSQFTHLENLKTNWYTLQPGKSMEMDLVMHFPSECGNEYQGTQLKARFTFEIRVPEDTAGPNNGGSNIDVSTHPKTGDSANIPLWSGLAAVSGCAALIFLFFIFRRKKQES